jgi:hypothetical protein
MRILGKLTGRLGFRVVSNRDSRLLTTVREELLPPERSEDDNFVPTRLIGNTGFHLNSEAQLALLDSFSDKELQRLFALLRDNREINAGFLGEDYRDRGLIHNGYYPSPDAELYAAMIARHRPAIIIEVGSGYSTVIARSTIEQLHLDCRIRVIDPCPRRDIEDYADQVEYSPVEKSSLTSEEVPAGALLFIDSSHVCRSDGDLPFLYCRLLPNLRQGILIHIHDVFIPYDYPSNYHERFYTEGYLLSALLAHSTKFEVAFATHFMTREYPDMMREVFGPGIGSDPLFYGSSFYLRTTV